MPKKKQNIKPDIVLKNYWSDNERFSDFFNAVLFNGRQILKPEELEDIDTDESYIYEHKNSTESIKKFRDNIKICKKAKSYGVELIMLGMESQENINYAMPLRVMGYDYGTYKKQYELNAGKYSPSSYDNADEYLSRMKKTDKFIPVVTVVVYYGEKPWDAALSLHGMLDIPQEMITYINDYKMFLIEARKSIYTFHDTKNKDLFNMLAILLDTEKSSNEIKNNAIEYADKNKVDKIVLMTVAGAVNNRINYKSLMGKENVDMCTVFEATWAEGKAEGKAEARIEGFKALINACKNLKVGFDETAEQLKQCFNLDDAEVQRNMKLYW